jgi:hypothetical protein
MLEFSVKSVSLGSHSNDLMKFLLLIPLVGVALATLSCRTLGSIDPMTMKPSERCLPDHLRSPSVIYAAK